MGDYRAQFGASEWLCTLPYKDLEEERISHIVETHTQTHSYTHIYTNHLTHNHCKARATTIEGRGLLPGASDSVFPCSECVDCIGASRVVEHPVTPMDYTGIIHTHSHTHTHINQHYKDKNGVCNLFLTFRVYLVKCFVRHKETCNLVSQQHI